MNPPVAAAQDKFVLSDFTRPVLKTLRCAVGEVVVASARLEYLILLGLKRSGIPGTLLAALQAASGVGGIEDRRRELRRRLIATRPPSDVRLAIDRLFSRLGTLFRERDRLVHGTLSYDPIKGLSRIRVVRGTQKDHRFDPVDAHGEAKRAAKAAAQMMAAVDELDSLTQERFWPPGVRIVGRGRRRRVVYPRAPAKRRTRGASA